MLEPVFIHMKNSVTTQNLTDYQKLVTATIITCCLAKLDIEPNVEHNMVLMQQFILEPDVEQRTCVHYDMVDNLLNTPQTRLGVFKFNSLIHYNMRIF